MRLLIFGDGNAREHATYDRLRAELGKDRVLFALTGPNALLSSLPGVYPVPSVESAVALARDHAVEVALILSPVPLVTGAADRFMQAGVGVFGVPARSAQLEASKTFGKQIMARARIPTPCEWTFDRADDASAFIRDSWQEGSREFVVKADGFFAAAHLRTTMPDHAEDACRAVMEMLGHGARAVIVEERVTGSELSVHVLFDGRDYILLPQVADQKRLFAGNEGPMTNGMGALATSAPWPVALERTIRQSIIEPTLTAIGGMTYRGLLYIGLMLTEFGPVCLEYNVRPGNPEWLALLPLLSNSLSELIEATVLQRLALVRLAQCAPSFAGTAFLVSAGYPNECPSVPPGVIRGLGEIDDDVWVHGEAIRRTLRGLCPANGRVIALTTLRPTRSAVRDSLIRNLDRVIFNGSYYREDVACQTLFSEADVNAVLA